MYARLAPYYDRFFSFGDAARAFFKHLVAALGARRLLDVASGSGFHAAEFASSGLDVLAVDLEPAMIRLAEARARAGSPFAARVADMRELTPVAGMGRWDILTCLGNSLPHLLTDQDLRTFCGEARAVLAEPGVAVIQTLNYDRIVAEAVRALPVIVRPEAGLRLERTYEPLEDGLLRFTTVLTVASGPDAGEHRQDVTLRPLLSTQLEGFLAQAGFDEVRMLGGFDGTPANAGSVHTVAVARRGGSRRLSELCLRARI
ncbi:MAG: class I SAM-dependent methyltransferase [Bacillota bacterium]